MQFYLAGMQAERAEGVLHLCPGHLDAYLHDLRVQVHVYVQQCFGDVTMLLPCNNVALRMFFPKEDLFPNDVSLP